MSYQRFRCYCAFIGNLFEHYDSALFSFLIPFIAHKIFPNDTTSIGLIKGFGLLPLTLLSKPLGSIFFSWLAKKKSHEFSLKISYVAVATITILIGCIPLNNYAFVNIKLLIALRLLQGFFSSGETINGAMYVLNESSHANKGLLSSLFDASSLAGFVIASCAITFCKSKGILDSHWHVLFWIGGLSCLPAFFLKKPKPILDATIAELRSFRQTFINFAQVSIACGLSYAFFALCFTFANGALPLLCKAKQSAIQHQTTFLLLFDIILLPIFGLLSTKIRSEILMKLSLSLSVVIIPLSFMLMPYIGSHEIFAIRSIWIILGSMFSANLYKFYHNLFPLRKDIILLSLATSIGASVLGHSFSSFAILIHQLSSNPVHIGFIFSALSILGLIMLQKNLKKNLI